MTEHTNLYQILGVPETAREVEIKKAYRRLSMSYHPDRNPGDSVGEEKTRQINQAYAVLGDSFKKKQYDYIRSRYHKKWAGSLKRKDHRFYSKRSNATNFIRRGDKVSKLRFNNLIRQDISVEELYNRGLALQLIKNYKNSKDYYMRVLSLAPKFGKAHLGLGEICYELGEVKRCYRHLTMAKDAFFVTGDVKNLKSTLKLLNKVTDA